jgi:hypothetical protein
MPSRRRRWTLVSSPIHHSLRADSRRTGKASLVVRTCSYNRPRRGAPHYTPERRSRWGRARNFLPALQGIKSGAQGNSRPDQGISRWSAIWRFAVVTTPIVPTDLERCRESEQGRCQIFEVADADLGARGRLCPSGKPTPRTPQNTSTQTIGVPGVTPSSPETAGGGSHPLSSTGERRTRQPDPTLCPEHLLSSILFLWHYDYSNQFCLNDRRNSIVPINI